VQLFSENHHGYNNAAVCRVLHINQILTTFGKITLEKKGVPGSPLHCPNIAHDYNNPGAGSLIPYQDVSRAYPVI
jgi:hypothetical protein